MRGETPAKASTAARTMILPLALAQFIASYAATNMNVAISTIAKDLGTTVAGVQTAITLFTLTMAALMIPGSKLSDIWGRKRCFAAGLIVYGAGALLATLAPGIGLLIFGYSLLEGVGSALMIPPVYILITVAFPDVTSRARYFGVVSGAGGLGAAAGPLIGGVVAGASSWRASFGLQVLVVPWIILLARKITEPSRSGRRPRFDLTGAVLSAAGLFFVVLGLLQSRTYGFLASRENFAIGNTVVIPKGSISPGWLFVGLGALFLLWFFLHVRSAEKKGSDVLLPPRAARGEHARRRAAAAAAVPQQDRQPGFGNPGHPVAGPAGIVLRGLGLSPGGQRLRRDPDRPATHPGHDRDPGRLSGGRPARQKAPAAEPDHRRLRGHRHRHDLAAGTGQGPLGRPHMGARAAAVRRGRRDHADLVGQRRPVELLRGRPR